jgi:hypothetical protein
VVCDVRQQLDGRVQLEQVVVIFTAGQLDGRRVEEAVAIWVGLFYFHFACLYVALPLWFHRAQQVVLICCIIGQVGQLAGGERWHRVPVPPSMAAYMVAGLAAAPPSPAPRLAADGPLQMASWNATALTEQKMHELLDKAVGHPHTLLAFAFLAAAVPCQLPDLRDVHPTGGITSSLTDDYIIVTQDLTQPIRLLARKPRSETQR